MTKHFQWTLNRVREFFRWFYRYRSIRVTAEGMRFILFTLAIGVAALNTGNNLLYLLLAMMLSLIVMSGILSEQCLKHLTIRRRSPAHMFAGRPSVAALSILNRKAQLPSFSLHVLDVVEGIAVERGIHLLHLPPRASVTQTYPILIARRGLHRIQGIKLVTRFPFGLFTKTATLPHESILVVYPEPKALPKALVHDLGALGHDQTMPRRGQGVSLYNLREYQAGDDSRTIHWKTSARRASLIVRETEAEDQRQVTLALPTAQPQTGPHFFEQAVVLIASLAAHFHERAFATRLVVGDHEVPHGLGKAHFYRILRELALCNPMPAKESGSVPEGFLTLKDRTTFGELTIVVLPWTDSEVMRACRGASRIFKAWEFL